MKKLILVAFVLMALFGISAGSSWFLRQGHDTGKEHGDEPDVFVGKGSKGHEKSAVSASAPTELRPAVRPAFNQEADNAAQLANNLRNQTEALRTREQQLVTRQKNLEMICQDIRTERAVMDDLRKQLNDELKVLVERTEALEHRAGDVKSKTDQLKEQKKQLTSSMVRIEDSEKESIKRLATVYDSMDSEAAAQQLQHMADTGKMETAVKILAGMRERQAAKVLTLFPDRTTVTQIVDRMKSVDRTILPTKTGNPAPLTGGDGH